MPYPKCPNCEHPWHGLWCSWETQTRGAWGGTINKPCGCPPQFQENENEG